MTESFFRRFAERFLRNQKGVVSVETAMIAPLLILVFALLLQTARLSLLYALADQATFEGIRSARLTPGTDPAPLVIERFEALAGDFVQKGSLKVTAENAVSVDAAARGEFIPGPGIDEAVVRLTLELNVPLIDVIESDTLKFGHRLWVAHYRNELTE